MHGRADPTWKPGLPHKGEKPSDPLALASKPICLLQRLDTERMNSPNIRGDWKSLSHVSPP